MVSSTHNLTAVSKAPDEISGMFNRIAKTYDLMNDCMTGGLHRQWKIKACKALQLQPGNTVLDVCTGTGDLAAVLSKIVGRDGLVTGIDFSESMLAIAQNRFSNLANIHWVQGDALVLPFNDNQFHGSIISFGLRNVASVHQALSEMIRVTRPGGWVVNLDTTSDCKNPLIWFYFSSLMPRLGKILSRDPKAYQYLFQSTQTFETPAIIQSYLEEMGLIHTQKIALGFGSVSIQIGQKPN